MLGDKKINIRQKEVFDKCFRVYYQTLCYFAYNYLKGQEEAEDVVQEVFIKLLDATESFDNEEHLKHYLYKAVRNACLNQIKLSGIRSEILNNIAKNSPQDENDFFVHVVRAEVYREIMAAVNELPNECGRVFKLAYVDGFSNEEVAEQLSISVNTVKSQKNKAKIQLREKLKGLYPVLLFFLNI
ncbi:RNA polymerase sigma-70 factor [Butyricimonas hominis]|uniref:RNA polymerase sigma factor n=1 Tax=Butyricimonas TaxID=574697 RepID=UPI00351711EE